MVLLTNNGLYKCDFVAPGGTISNEGDSDGPSFTDVCVFKTPGGRETIKAWYEVSGGRCIWKCEERS